MYILLLKINSLESKISPSVIDYTGTYFGDIYECEFI